jgi:uncharacterized metal-binding protein
MHEEEKSNQAYHKLPLVYSCSGCSSAAQLANKLAVRMDRSFMAEMSCIAGVGGNVSSLVRKAQSGRDTIVFDGCSLHCARKCLQNIDTKPTIHIDLSTHKIKKVFHEDASPEEEERIWSEVVVPLLNNQKEQEQ